MRESLLGVLESEEAGTAPEQWDPMLCETSLSGLAQKITVTGLNPPAPLPA
jgi:hypothetical protein